MSSFCYECAVLMMFEPVDFLDPRLKGSDTYRVVLCEDCGPIQVDWQGRCMTEDCDGTRPHGHRTPGAERVLRDHEEWAGRRSGPLGPLWRLRDTLLGSPYGPGYVHELRWRYHDARERIGRRLSRRADDALDLGEFAEWTPPVNVDVAAEKAAARRIEAARTTPRGADAAGFPREKDQ